MGGVSGALIADLSRYPLPLPPGAHLPSAPRPRRPKKCRKRPRFPKRPSLGASAPAASMSLLVRRKTSLHHFRSRFRRRPDATFVPFVGHSPFLRDPRATIEQVNYVSMDFMAARRDAANLRTLRCTQRRDAVCFGFWSHWCGVGELGSLGLLIAFPFDAIGSGESFERLSCVHRPATVPQRFRVFADFHWPVLVAAH